MRVRPDANDRTPRSRLLALTSAAIAAMVVATSAVAAGPSVQVEPAGPLPQGTQTLTVTGSGFDPVGNHGNGIYVVFGPITPAPAYYLDPSIYAAFKWVHPSGQESGAESPMGADGSFSTTLDVPSSFVSPQGTIDCTAVPCALITFGAHGSQDRSQDTCTALQFAPAPGSPAPAVSIAPAQSGVAEASPIGSAMTGDVVASPGVGDACAAIGGVTAP